LSNNCFWNNLIKKTPFLLFPKSTSEKAPLKLLFCCWGEEGKYLLHPIVVEGIDVDCGELFE